VEEAVTDATETASDERKRRVVNFSLSGFWVLVICIPLVAFGTWVAIDHANANQARQNRKNLALLDQRNQQGLALLRATTAYSVNKSACGWHAFLDPLLNSYVKAAADKSLSPSAQARNAKRIRDTTAFLATQVTIPEDFACAKLPKHAPRNPPPTP
jgi:hypothetical protein